MPDSDTIILPPLLAPPAGYYALMARYKRAAIAWNAPYSKRNKATHRIDIADTHGPTRLTIPIERPASESRSTWEDVRISSHGQWWHTHWDTLQSAYGRTPFWEFYAPDFAPLFTPDMAGKPLTDMLKAMDTLLRRHLQIPTGTADIADIHRGDAADFSRGIPAEIFPEIGPYYQVRAHTQGFHPMLSALDLLFNLGPEATLFIY